MIDFHRPVLNNTNVDKDIMHHQLIMNFCKTTSFEIRKILSLFNELYIDWFL